MGYYKNMELIELIVTHILELLAPKQIVNKS